MRALDGGFRMVRDGLRTSYWNCVKLTSFPTHTLKIGPMARWEPSVAAWQRCTVCEKCDTCVHLTYVFIGFARRPGLETCDDCRSHHCLHVVPRPQCEPCQPARQRHPTCRQGVIGVCCLAVIRVFYNPCVSSRMLAGRDVPHRES